MKKLLTVALALLMLAGIFAGCKPAEPTYEIAMITDIGDIDDKSFNQGTWDGIQEYAKANDITHKYYKPTEKTTDAYVAAIDLAIKGGAKIVVTPGYLFEPAIFQAQDKYPDIKFVLLDGSPQDGTYTEFRIEDNVYSIFYAEQQSGFMAGYAAVKDGYTKLGFLGGIAVPAVVRFGYGFVAGVDYAAEELGIDGIEIKYGYAGNFDATPENQALAAAWYGDGTEVIFAAGGKVGNSVMAAAEAADGKVIGVDVDQSSESETVITSAKKELGVTVQQALADFYADSFKGGVIDTLDITVDAVGLPIDNSRFETFSKADYEALYSMLQNDEGGVTSSIPDDTTVTSAAELSTDRVMVTVVE